MRGVTAASLAMLLLPVAAVGQVVFINAGTSMNPVGSGARAMGQGNAFIAVADDATAASWNPAGLTQLEKPELSLALEMVDSHAEMESSDRHPESERASIRGDATDLNYFSAVVPLRLAKHTVASLSYLTVYRFDRSLETQYSLRAGTWGQNAMYTIRQEGKLSVLAPALAVDVTPKLALGVAFGVWADDWTGGSEFRSLTSQHAHFFDTASGKVGDQWFGWEDRFTVDDGFSWSLGAMYRPTQTWTLAAVAKPPFTLEMNHTCTVTDHQTGGFGWSDSRGEREWEAEFTLPLILAAGAAWRPSDPWTVSADLTWTQWSRYKLREFGQDWNPVTGQPWARGACKDTTTVRCGLEYLVIRPAYVVPLRCGFGYDPGPAAEEIDEFWTASLGTGLQWSRHALDMAYEIRYGDGVNRELAPGLGQQDFLQHRFLLSLITYF